MSKVVLLSHSLLVYITHPSPHVRPQRTATLTHTSYKDTATHSLFLKQVLVLLLLLLPVRLDRVLRQVLHEFQGLLDLQQHLIGLAAPHLREEHKERERKNEEL